MRVMFSQNISMFCNVITKRDGTAVHGKTIHSIWFTITVDVAQTL